MNWITKYFLICIFLSGTCLTKGESKGSIFRAADSLMYAGQFRDARIELEKIAFFNSDQTIVARALIKKAECFKNEKCFQKAYNTLNRIFLPLQPDSLLFRIKYNKALDYYLNKEPGRAVFELQSLDRFVDKEKAGRVRFLSALSYSDLKEWEKSKNEALRFIALSCNNPEKSEMFTMKINKLFDPRNIPQTLSEKKAKNISTFIPGGGQIYAGKIGEGSFCFVLHGALLYFGVTQFLDNFYFTGYTAGFGLLQRLYAGNLQRSQDLVVQVNKQRYDRFFTDYFTLLNSVSEYK